MSTYTYDGITYRRIGTTSTAEVISVDVGVDGDRSTVIFLDNVLINGVDCTVTTITSTTTEQTFSTIRLPSGLVTIGNDAFYGSNLQYTCDTNGLNIVSTMRFPDTLQSIGDRAFMGSGAGNKYQFATTIFNDGLLQIGDYAFTGATTNNGQLTIPASVTNIGDYAFCEFNDSINPHPVTQLIVNNPLVTNVFLDSFNSLLGSIYIQYYSGSSIKFGTVTSYDELPENWKKISQYYQQVTPSQVPFTIDDNIYYQSVNGLTAEALYPVVNTLSSPIIKGSVTINSVVLPVTLIAENCFNGYTSLISLTIPNSVTTIGSYAFYNCSSLTSLTIPNSVTTIGSYAFQNCSSLTSLTIPNSVTTISSYAFSYCISLTSVTIPISTTLIDIAVFYYCSSLTQVIISNPLMCNVNSSSFTDMRNGTSYYGSSITFGTVSSYNELPANWKTISQYYETQNYASPLVCFKEDSKILTSSGYKLIQELKKGDSIKTLKNGYKQVELIGKREMYHVACKDRIKDQLYKCSSDKYPELFEDLIITGCHSILVDNFINDEQKEMVYNLHNRFYVTDEKYRLPIYLDDKSDIYNNSGSHIIYHIALENENYTGNYGIFANGLLVESCSKRYLKELSNMELI